MSESDALMRGASRWHESVVPEISAPGPTAAVVAPEPRTAWCVERGSLESPQYLSVQEGRCVWTPYVRLALRLSRREDAERMAGMVRGADRLAEHLWA